jgi:hypothetical protein
LPNTGQFTTLLTTDHCRVFVLKLWHRHNRR